MIGTANDSLGALLRVKRPRRAVTVSRNYWIRGDQDEMIRALAEHQGESQVTVLRTILDEWREMKMRDLDE